MACIKKRGEANLEKMAPEGSSKRAMALTGSVGSVVGGGVAGAVLAGPAAPLGFVVGALVGGLVVAGVLVSDGVLDEQATDADNEQPANVKLEDALLGNFRGDKCNGPDARSRPFGSPPPTGGKGTTTDTDLFSRLGGKGPNPWLPAKPAKSGGGPNAGNGSGDGRGGGSDGGSKAGQGGSEVGGESGGGNGGAAHSGLKLPGPLDRLSTKWTEWTTKHDDAPGYGEEGWRGEQAWKTK